MLKCVSMFLHLQVTFILRSCQNQCGHFWGYELGLCFISLEEGKRSHMLCPHGSSYIPFSSFIPTFFTFFPLIPQNPCGALPSLDFLFSYFFHPNHLSVCLPPTSCDLSVSFLWNTVSLFLSDVWYKEWVGHAPYEGHACRSLHHLSVCSSRRP